MQGAGIPCFFPMQRVKEANHTGVGSHHNICTICAKPNQVAQRNLQGNANFLKGRLVALRVDFLSPPSNAYSEKYSVTV